MDIDQWQHKWKRHGGLGFDALIGELRALASAITNRGLYGKMAEN
jgi:hypothetical protein